jgi:hypothetical protein
MLFGRVALRTGPGLEPGEAIQRLGGELFVHPRPLAQLGSRRERRHSAGNAESEEHHRHEHFNEGDTRPRGHGGTLHQSVGTLDIIVAPGEANPCSGKAKRAERFAPDPLGSTVERSSG